MEGKDIMMKTNNLLPRVDVDHLPLLVYFEKAGLLTGFLVSFALPSLNGPARIVFLIGLALWIASVTVADGLDMMGRYSSKSVIAGVIIPFAIELYTASFMGADSIPGMIIAAIVAVLSVYMTTIVAQRLEPPDIALQRADADM